MDILQELLEDDSSQRFLKENWLRIPYSRPFAARNFVSYFEIAHLDEVAKEGKSTIKVIKQNQIVESQSRFPTGYLASSLKQAQSIVIRHAEKSLPQLEKLALNFTKTFNAHVDIQVFVTPPMEQTFDWHYDGEEVFILQTYGQKKFFLRQNTINPNPRIDNLPQNLRYEEETSDVFLSCELKAGDWLYIPKGWWHRAQAHTQTSSIHLSIGLDLCEQNKT